MSGLKRLVLPKYRLSLYLRVSLFLQEPTGGKISHRQPLKHPGTNSLLLSPSSHATPNAQRLPGCFNEPDFRLINEGKMGIWLSFFFPPSLNTSDGSLKAISSAALWCYRHSCCEKNGSRNEGDRPGWVIGLCLFPSDPLLLVFCWEGRRFRVPQLFWQLNKRATF